MCYLNRVRGDSHAWLLERKAPAMGPTYSIKRLDNIAVLIQDLFSEDVSIRSIIYE